MSNQMGKHLFEVLEQSGMLEYGSVILSSVVRNAIGIKYPEVGTKKQFDTLALTELAAIDYVRNVLLGRGMYLSQNQGDYRILLPSENARQVELYISSADKKLNRALKLTRNMPKTDLATQSHQTEARIVMKKLGARRSLSA